jgi:hypothetical protein
MVRPSEQAAEITGEMETSTLSENGNIEQKRQHVYYAVLGRRNFGLLEIIKHFHSTDKQFLISLPTSTSRYQERLPR